MTRHPWFRLSLVVAVMAVIAAGSPVGLAAAPAADIAGNTYTSPQFGYSLTWPDTWYVEDETSDTFDRLHLSDGLAYLAAIGGRSFGGNSVVALTVFATLNKAEEGIIDYA